MSDRKELTGKITVRDEAIAAEREQEIIVFANLGQSVFDSELAEDKFLDKQKNAIVGITGRIRDLEESLRRLLADDEKRSALQEEKKSLNVELRNIKNKEEPLFEELGRSTWELWKSGRIIDERMEEALDDLVKAELRLQAAEDAMFRNEKDSGSKAVSIISRGKAFFLAGRRKTASAALDRLWGHAGRKLREMIIPEAFTDTPAAVSSSTLSALSRRRDEITERVKALTGETEVLDSTLEELPGKGGVHRRVAWIENALDKKRIELDDAFRNLGEAWLGNTSGKSVPAAVENRRNEWTAINKRIGVLEEERKAFSAHREYSEFKALRDKKAIQVSKLEDEVKSRQAELKSLKKEMLTVEKNLSVQKESLPPLPTGS